MEIMTDPTDMVGKLIGLTLVEFDFSSTPDLESHCFHLCEINKIHHRCSVRTGKSQPECWDFLNLRTVMID